MRHFTAICLLTLIVVPSLHGQGLVPGQRLRFTTTTDPVRQVGVVDSITAGRVWLRVADRPPQEMALTDLRDAQVSQGRSYTPLFLGIVAGAVAGGLAFTNLEDTDGELAGLLAPIYIGGGALVGGGIGLILSHERWQAIDPRTGAAARGAWNVGLRLGTP
jgi:hypothetical protein